MPNVKPIFHLQGLSDHSDFEPHRSNLSKRGRKARPGTTIEQAKLRRTIKD